MIMAMASILWLWQYFTGKYRSNDDYSVMFTITATQPQLPFHDSVYVSYNPIQSDALMFPVHFHPLLPVSGLTWLLPFTCPKPRIHYHAHLCTAHVSISGSPKLGDECIEHDEVKRDSYSRNLKISHIEYLNLEIS